MPRQKSIPGKFGLPYLCLQHRPLPPDSAGQIFWNQIRGYCLYASPKMIESIISLLISRLEPNDDLYNARAFLSIAAAYMARHKLTRSLEDLQAAAILLLEVAHATPDGHVDKAMVHDLAATAHVELCACDESNLTVDLATAAQHFSIAVRLEPDRDYQAVGFHFIAAIRHGLYKKTGDVAFLDEYASDTRLSLKQTRKVDSQWFNRSQALSMAQSSKYSESRDVKDAKSAIKHAQDILDYQPEDYALSHEQLAKLGSAYRLAGVRHRDTEILDKAIGLFDNILDTMAEDHAFRAEALCQHGKVYEAKYEVTGEVAFLEVAARQAKEAVELTPQSDGIWKPHLFRAVKIWSDLYQQSKTIENLETADGFLEEVMAFLDEDSEPYYVALNKRAMLSYHRTFHLRDASSLATAIDRVKDVLQKVPLEKRGGNDYDHCLEELLATQRTFQVPSPSHQSRDAGGLGVEGKDSQPNIDPQPLSVDWLADRIPMIGFDDISPAQEWLQLTKEAPHTSYQDEKTELNSDSTLNLLHSSTTILSDVTKLKELSDQLRTRLPAEYLTESTDVDWSNEGIVMAGLNALAAWNQYYWELKGPGSKWLGAKMYGEARRPISKAELDKLLDSAIQALEKMLAPEIPEMLKLVEILRDLATAYHHRWARTQDEIDLDRAIEVLKRALGKVSADNKQKPSLLHHIGYVFLDKYRTRGALADLEAGIQHLELAPVSQLALAGLLKIQAGGTMQAQLAEMKSLLQNPQTIVQTHGEELFKYLGSLGEAYFALFHRTRKHTDLVRGLAWVDSVTAARTLKSIVVKQSLLPALSLGYIEKFRVTKDLVDADLSISCLKESMGVAVYLEDGEVFIRQAVQLSELVRDRHTVSEDAEDLSRELYYLQGGLEKADDDDEYKALCLEKLGKAYQGRHGRTGDEGDLQKAVGYLQEALSYDKDWPVHGIIGGKELFRIYVSQGNWLQAHAVASTIFARVHRTIGWALESRDKQALLRQYAGLASDAAAAAVLAGQSAFTALRYLETGRGVIASSLLGLRSELDDLERDHPELAQQYAKARNQIDYVKRAPRNEAAQWLPVNQPTYRHQATKALDTITETIRSLPGYASFLKEMPEEKMRAAATTAAGPIVIINVSRYCCHAIIIREEDGITNHLLPNLKMEDIEWRAQKNSVQAMTSDELEWLWDEIVSPIMTILEYNGPPLPADNCPSHRVWWIPTGPLARLPLHAAGYHNDPTSRGQTALDRVISSYSLSVHALVQSQASLSKAETASLSSPLSSHRHDKPELVVLIGMDDLQNAPQETREVAKICRDMLVKRPEAQTDHLLRALRTADIFHFAGHGSSDVQDPLKSALILRGQDRLTVSNLFEMNLHERRPFLAFLSACSTGKIRQDDALDEGLHLISACQVAGFRHVIGTLWEVDDSACVQVAQMVYKWMHQRGLVHASVSESLHFACRSLRDEWARGEEDKRAWRREREDAARAQGRDITDFESLDKGGPLFWVPYVHYGV